MKIQTESKQVKFKAGSYQYVSVIKDDLSHYVEVIACIIANSHTVAEEIWS
jgi:hypothetical protein